MESLKYFIHLCAGLHLQLLTVVTSLLKLRAQAIEHTFSLALICELIFYFSVLKSELPLVGNAAPDFEAEAVFDQEFIKVNRLLLVNCFIS